MTIALVGIGIPGSGKSTLLKPLAEELDFTYVNRDDMRAQLLGNATDRTQQDQVHKAADALAAAALRQDSGVVYDASFSTPQKRADVIRILAAAGAERIIGIWMDTSLEVALERNAARDRNVRDEVIRDMHAALERDPPTTDEGFFAVIRDANPEALKRALLAILASE